MQEQNFETVAHNLNDLRKMNGFEQNLNIKMAIK